jgi:hypothetical protein
MDLGILVSDQDHVLALSLYFVMFKFCLFNLLLMLFISFPCLFMFLFHYV